MNNLFNKQMWPMVSGMAIMLLCAGCATTAKEGIYETYFRTGAVKTIKPYANGKLNGICREYYEMGTLKHAMEYKNGQLDGIYNTYLPDGSVWKKAVYRDGRFLSQWEYDEEGILIEERDARD